VSKEKKKVMPKVTIHVEKNTMEELECEEEEEHHTE